MLTIHRAARLSDHAGCVSVLFIGGTTEFDNPMILGTYDPTWAVYILLLIIPLKENFLSTHSKPGGFLPGDLPSTFLLQGIPREPWKCRHMMFLTYAMGIWDTHEEKRMLRAERAKCRRFTCIFGQNWGKDTLRCIVDLIRQMMAFECPSEIWNPFPPTPNPALPNNTQNF
jgi:hypothetical protein